MLQRSRAVVLSLGLGVASIGAVGGVALAADDRPASSDASAVGITPQMRQHLTDAYASVAKGHTPPRAAVRGERDQPTAAQLAGSQTAHRGRISAAAAHALAAKAVPALAGSDPIVPPAEQVERALGPTAVQLKGSGDRPGGVVIADVPLAVASPDAKDGGDWRLADYRFQRQGSRFVVRRAPVPTSIPDSAGGVFQVGPFGVRLAPADSTATATAYDTDVVHANADADTDLVTRSVGSGMRYGWILRGPDADETQTAKLDLPDGATTRLRDDGAVSILDRTGEPVGEVSPAASDAAGRSVPLDTTLDGGTVSYRLKVPLKELELPVVIDPEVMVSRFDTGPVNANGWVWATSNNTQAPFSTSMDTTGTAAANGLRAKGAAGTGYGAGGAWGGWTHWAPGDPNVGTTSSVSGQKVSNEHGWFWKAEIGGVEYINPGLWPWYWQDPNPSIGMLSSWDTNHPANQKHQRQNGDGSWGATVNSQITGVTSGTTGATYREWVGDNPDVMPASGKNDSVFSATLYDYGYNASGPRPESKLRIGWTKLYAGDNVAPLIGTITPPSGWVKEDYALPVAASDAGTGIDKVEFYSQANPPALYGPGVKKTCPAVGKELCPYAFNDTVPVAPLPEGIGTYDVRATDGGGKTTNKPVSLKVDKSGPQITLSGDLYTQRATELSGHTVRALEVAVTDGVLGGTATQQRSGVEKIEIYSDNQLVSTTAQTVAGDSQGLTATWSVAATDTDPGTHDIRVVATDRTGHTTEAPPFEIVKAWPNDSVAPEASAGGDLSDLDGDYLRNGLPQELTLYGTDEGDDDPSAGGGDTGSGIEKLGLTIDGQPVHSVTIDCTGSETGDPNQCPSDADADVSTMLPALAEGAHVFAATATDAAGHSGTGEPWTVYVDLTPPTASTDLAASYDSTANETTVQWSGDGDPDLVEDVTEGSGVESWSVRYRVNGGAWSPWEATESPTRTLSGGTVGDVIDVEVKSIDLAGNVSAAAALSTTSYEAAAPGAQLRANDPRTGKVGCSADTTEADRDYTRVDLVDFAGEPLIAIKAFASMRCYPADRDDLADVAAFKISRDWFKVCVETEVEPGRWERLTPQSCSRKSWVKRKAGNFSSAVRRASGKGLCLAGQHRYRIAIHVETDTPGYPENHTERDVAGKERDLGCNEAGAWRRNAQRPKGSASYELGVKLEKGIVYSGGPETNTWKDPIPRAGYGTGRTRGWDAHHIVSKGNRENALAGLGQAYAYACGIYPNGAVNGVWLRGRPLRTVTKAFERLPDDLQRRAQHDRTFNDRYFDWVRRSLSPMVYHDGPYRGQCRGSVGQSDLVAELKRLRLLMIAGNTHD